MGHSRDPEQRELHGCLTNYQGVIMRLRTITLIGVAILALAAAGGRAGRTDV